jgi:hypothetical protein
MLIISNMAPSSAWLPGAGDTYLFLQATCFSVLREAEVLEPVGDGLRIADQEQIVGYLVRIGRTRAGALSL